MEPISSTEESSSAEAVSPEKPSRKRPRISFLTPEKKRPKVDLSEAEFESKKKRRRTEPIYSITKLIVPGPVDTKEVNYTIDESTYNEIPAVNNFKEVRMSYTTDEVSDYQFFLLYLYLLGWELNLKVFRYRYEV